MHRGGEPFGGAGVAARRRRDDLAPAAEHRHVDEAAGDEAGHYRGDLPTEPVHAATLWTGSANVAPFRRIPPTAVWCPTVPRDRARTGPPFLPRRGSR